MKYNYIKVYKTTWCGDCRIADAFFEQNNIKINEVINIDEDFESAAIVENLNNGNRSVPTIVVGMEDGSKIILVEPNWEELNNIFNR